MKVNVRLNGIMCAQCDWNQREFELDGGATVSDLKRAIEDFESGIQFELLRANTAVNQEIVTDERELHDLDEISFLPPLAGG